MLLVPAAAPARPAALLCGSCDALAQLRLFWWPVVHGTRVAAPAVKAAGLAGMLARSAAHTITPHTHPPARLQVKQEAAQRKLALQFHGAKDHLDTSMHEYQVGGWAGGGGPPCGGNPCL